MNYLLRLLQRFHQVIIFIVLFVASVWMYIDTSYYQKARFSKFACSIAGSVASQFWNLGQYMKFKEANISLREENIFLKNELERYKNELTRGGAIIRIDSLPGRSNTYISARVVDNTTNLRQNYIILNVGKNSGVNPGMGVVCAHGVVGIITSVLDNNSSVISMLNTNTKISARHKKSGAFGSLIWNGEDYRKVMLTDIPLHINLSIGDTIATSGYSALFPPDIPIGEIVDFEKDEGNVYSIDVELFADFKLLDYVYVVNVKDFSERNELEQMSHD